MDTLNKHYLELVEEYPERDGEYVIALPGGESWLRDFLRQNRNKPRRFRNKDYVGKGTCQPATWYKAHYIEKVKREKRRQMISTREGWQLARFCGCGGMILDSRMHLHKCYLNDYGKNRNSDWAWRMRNG